MSDVIWVKESPIALVAGAKPTYTIEFVGATTVSATGATMEVYRNESGTDQSATYTDSGTSLSASGNILSLKKLHALVGGNVYTVSVLCTVDGVVEVRKIMLIVQTARAKQ